MVERSCLTAEQKFLPSLPYAVPIHKVLRELRNEGTANSFFTDISIRRAPVLRGHEFKPCWKPEFFRLLMQLHQLRSHLRGSFFILISVPQLLYDFCHIHLSKYLMLNKWLLNNLMARFNSFSSDFLGWNNSDFLKHSMNLQFRFSAACLALLLYQRNKLAYF